MEMVEPEQAEEEEEDEDATWEDRADQQVSIV
jgi:hypothetical protein